MPHALDVGPAAPHTTGAGTARAAESAPEPAPEPAAAFSPVDVVVGLASLVVDAAGSGGRAVLRPAARRIRRLPVPGAALRPGGPLAVLGRRGAERRVAAGLGLSRLLDLAVAQVDADAVVRRVDLDALVGRLDLTGIVLERVDLDRVVGAVLDRLDLVRLSEGVIDAIDLPGIIRESTGSMASETMHDVRMQGIAADEAVGRVVDRLLLRGRRGSAASAAGPSPLRSGPPALRPPSAETTPGQP
jgi:hypothetical protein